MPLQQAIGRTLCAAALSGLVLWGMIGAGAPVRGAENAIRAELKIPPARTHVIGDSIPLFWRFQNTGSEPVGFMWEGCCRLNGRLLVTRQGGNVSLLPPAQALAHMFAKAERLDPGVARDFDTLVSDWAELPGSGTYELRGRYTGVLPSQQPQVPRGLALWREAAETPPIELTVLSVEDYLAQREARIPRRGVRIDLQAPAILPPLAPLSLKITVRNESASPQPLHWPHDLELWIVDQNGRRLASSLPPIGGASEEMILPPGGRFEREIPFSSDFVEGEPFGAYRVFADLKEKPGHDRVPSNAPEFKWSLDASEIRSLITEAVSGTRAGVRNPPLKLLRVHLADLRGDLAQISEAGLDQNAVSLLRQLQLASSLKEFGPKPGRFDLPVTVDAGGGWRIGERMLKQVRSLAALDPKDQLKAILGVRRHLGWDIHLAIEPEPATSLAKVKMAVESLKEFQSAVSAEPKAIFPNTEPQVAGTISLPDAVHQRVPIPRIGRASSGLVIDLGNGTAGDPAALVAALLQEPRAGLRTAPDLTWGELIALVRPALEQGLQLEVLPSE
jgi:hypothetical protein